MANDVTIANIRTDNRSVLEVRGKEFGLQPIIDLVENVISKNTKIEEVRFVSGKLFRIDANLPNQVWHGKNVVVHARELLVPSPVCWDLSGKDDTHEYSQSAGTGEDGTGLNGKDGYPGESGGNVLIMAKEITNPEHMTIIANGGAGSDGQDGGNGKHGKDGTGKRWSEFRDEFPPVASMDGVRHADLNTTLKNLKKPGITITKEEVNDRHTLKILTNSLRGWTYLLSFTKVEFQGLQIEDCYFECKTDDGHTITFSYQDGDLMTQNCQAFLLYEGSPGTPGMSGGEYGMGGQGGKAGEVTVQCLTNYRDVDVHIISKAGANGKNGKGGVGGRHGKRGWDVGYADHFWGRRFGPFPIYYGSDENSTLKLSAYSSNSSNRVYCPYLSDNSSTYVEITSSRLRHPDQQTFEERNNSRSNSERQHHARALGKKTISRQSVLNAYSEFMQEVEREIEEEEANRRHEEECARQRAREAELVARQAAEREAQEERQRAYEAEQARLAAETQRLEEFRRAHATEVAARQATAQNVQQGTTGGRRLHSQPNPACEPKMAALQAAESRLQHSNRWSYQAECRQHPYEVRRAARQAAEKKLQEKKQAAEAEKKAKEEKRAAAKQKVLEEKQRAFEAECERQAAANRRQEELQLAHAMSRCVSLEQDIKRQHCKVTVNISKVKQDNDQEGNATNCDSFTLNDWLSYSTKAVHEKDLILLLSKFATDRTSYLQDTDTDEGNKTIDEIDEMFFRKYKFQAMQKLPQLLPLYLKCETQHDYTAETISQFLKETKEKNGQASHVILGSMKQYLYENTPEIRSKIVTFIKQEMKDDDEVLRRAIKSFVLDTEYVDNIDECMETFYRELSKPQHKELLPFWDADSDEETNNEFRRAIQKDEALKALYDSLNEAKRVKAQYETSEMIVDEQVKQKFIEYIQSKGVATSGSCREFLAYVFDVNLRVYTTDEDFEYVLLEEHNPSSTTKNHILIRDDELVQMEINAEYLQMAQERLYKDTLFGNILMELDYLPTIGDIEQFLTLFDVETVASTQSYDEENDSNDKVTAETLASYFPEEKCVSIRKMLEKVTYSNEKRMLQCMVQRFACEGRHISADEMSMFINSLLDSIANGGQEAFTYTWIVAAYQQQNWVDEALLLHLETHFKQQLPNKQQWRAYMSKMMSKDVLVTLFNELQVSTCTIECMNDILHLLSSVPIESIAFDGIKLSEWGYFLKEHYWTHKLKALVEWNEEDRLSDASYYMSCVENTFGYSKANDLIDCLKGKDQLTSKIVLKILSNLQKQKWLLTDEEIHNLKASQLQDWIATMEQKYKPQLEDFNIQQLAEILESDQNTSKRILNNLPTIRTSIQHINDVNTSYNQKLVAKFTYNDIKIWQETIGVKLYNATNDDTVHIYAEMLAVIDRAIELKRGFRLRDTQRLTILALLTNTKSTLAQVSTGEGKSLIVVATSIVKALFHNKVDIVTSSPVLAKRDSEVNKDIYELFGVSVHHNCSEDLEQRKEAYSNYQVVYGDLASFQRDYLLDRFYGKNILGDRDFSCVIVDEVDSMLVDKGNNMLYLSHDIPGMDKLESVYVFIWQVVNSSPGNPEDIDTDEIKNIIMNNLYDRISFDDLKKLDPSLSTKKVKSIWQCLVNGGVIDTESNIVKNAIDSSRLEKVLPPEFAQYKHRLSFLLTECVNREKHIIVPNYLKKFVERHLTSWIDSAINALLMEPDHSYVVSFMASGVKTERSIVILDKDTGTDQGSSQWDEALHQFLQLKHGCKLSLQSLKAVFLSNVSYFKLYKLLYGLTGTLGSQGERHLLKEVHQVDFVTIPPTKSKQFDEYDPIICLGHNKWLESIRTEVDTLVNEQHRSVLIICDTINDVQSVEKCLKAKGELHISTYTRDFEEFDVVQGTAKLQQGEIIIATNLAGRGTDIRITDEVRKAGGLHVILTYLPENIRIEEQAFGRAARSGDKGSGRMILMVRGRKQFRKSKIIDLKKKRDKNELYRISEVKSYYEKHIVTEENCFNKFKKVYEKHREALDNADVPKEVKAILLESCLDQWAFWLDEHSSLMEEFSHECDEKRTPPVLKTFLNKMQSFQSGECTESYLLSSLWEGWVAGNPMRMIKLGKHLAEHHVKVGILKDLQKAGKQLTNMVKKTFDDAKIVVYAYETAMSLFEKVIQLEPQFCEAAYYYRAYTVMKSAEIEQTTDGTSNETIEQFKKDLRAAMELFEAHHTAAVQAAGIVGKSKNIHVSYDDYKEQKERIAKLYLSFTRSIEDILGYAVTPDAFVSDDNITADQAERICKYLTDHKIASKPQVRKNVSDQQLLAIHEDYGIPVEDLRTFFSAKAGKEIDEGTFLKECESTFKLPSKEQFWELLDKQKVISDIQEYVRVDNTKLKKVNPSLMDAIEEIVKKEKLLKQSIELTNEQIVLYHDWLTYEQTENTDSKANVSTEISKKEDLTQTVAEQQNELLDKKGITTSNQKANDDASKISSCVPESSDSVSDLSKKATTDENEVKLSTKTGDKESKARVSMDIFKKDDFIKAFGREQYEMLVKKGIITINKKANIDKSKLLSCVPEWFDSVSVQDLIKKANIEQTEAELIMNELIKQGTLEPSVGDSYKLKDSFNDKKDDLVPSYPVYEPAVRALLAGCFAYRLELKHLKDQLEDLESGDGKVIRINLASHPYVSFFEDLLKQNIIRPCKIENENFNEQMEQICMKNLTKTEWRDIFIEVLAIPTTDADQLVSELIKNKCLHKRSIGTKMWDNASKLTQLQFQQMSVTSYYDIGEEKDFKSIVSITLKCSGTVSYDIGKTVVQYLNQQRKIREASTQTHVINSLKSLKSSIVGLKVPGIYLKSIQEVTKNTEINFGTIDEEYIFNLNGLERLIQLKEQKGMLGKATAVALIGLGQIALGGLIEFCSVGWLTHVASSFMSEGLNDISYAVNALHTGHFSWKEYAVQKMKSILFTGITAGVAALCSRAVKQSKIMKKIFNSGLCTEGESICATTARSQLGTKLENKVISVALKRVGMKIVQGAAQGVANVMVDTIVDDYLQSMVNGLAADVLRTVLSKVDDHKATQSLKQVYDQLGEQRARQLIQEINSSFGTYSWESYVSIVGQMVGSLSHGFASALQKTESKSITLKILSTLGTVWVWGERALQLGRMGYEVSQFLNTMDAQMCEKLKSRVANADGSECSKPKEDGFDKFKSETVRQWRALLSEHVGKLITMHFIKPLLHDALKRIGRHIKRVPLKIRERRLRKKVKKEKAAHDALPEEQRKLHEHQYHEKLQKIMYKTKSPALFADIIQEGVPMDLTCVDACTKVIQKFLKAKNIPTDALIVDVQAEDGISQTFASGEPGAANAKKVTLQLTGGHFSFSENQQNVDGNNCMYAALCEAMPELKDMTADEFRKQIADTIRADPSIQHHIRQGWHRYPIKAFNCIGGRRQEPPESDELEKKFKSNKRYLHSIVIPLSRKSETFSGGKNLTTKKFRKTKCIVIRNTVDHIFNRVTVYPIEAAATIQAAMKISGMAWEVMFESGGSNSFDKLPNALREGKFDRAHGVKLRIKKENFTTPEQLQALAMLQNCLGRREYVYKEANMTGNIAGDIDNIQPKLLKEFVHSYDFAQPDNSRQYVKDFFSRASEEVRSCTMKREDNKSNRKRSKPNANSTSGSSRTKRRLNISGEIEQAHKKIQKYDPTADLKKCKSNIYDRLIRGEPVVYSIEKNYTSESSGIDTDRPSTSSSR
uniref:uncharacterized protein LOC120956889 n=1 Tax=Anopheles coluzzii TaxID=1518534 RepID=UPI0020FF896F|nr:uncharacterized protein LOC120956889 [Anopheles coluzzii]